MISILQFFSLLGTSIIFPVNFAHSNPDNCPQHLKTRYKLISGSSSRIEISVITDEIREIITKTGTGNLRLAVITEQGVPVAFGSEIALKDAKRNVAKHRLFTLKTSGASDFDQIRFKLADGSESELTLSSALIGSSIKTQFYGDLDFETVLIANYKNFKSADLHDKNSNATQTFVKFLKEYATKLTKEGYIFSDFKAGELPAELLARNFSKTKSRSIKWSYDELITGIKKLEMPDGTIQTVTLEEAITSESRIKIDWLIKMAVETEVTKATQMKERYFEASVLFSLGGKHPQSEPILRIAKQNVIPERGATGAHLAIENHVTVPPLRVTSVFFSERDLEMARKLSFTSPLTDLSYLNALTLQAVKTYWDNGDIVKVMKRLSSRLYYWDDLKLFNHYIKGHHLDRKTPITADHLYKILQTIISPDSSIGKISQYKNSAINLVRLSELGLSKHNDELELIDLVKKYFINNNYPEKVPENISDFEIFLEKKIQSIAHEELKLWPTLNQYMNFVLKNETLTVVDKKIYSNVFLSYKPEQKYVKTYESFLDKHAQEFANLEFASPQDLHITLAYVGNISESQGKSVYKIIEKYRNKIEGAQFNFNDGRMEIMGRNSNLISLVFDDRSLPQEIRQSIIAMKQEIAALGISNDPFVNTFLPHITIAKMKGTDNQTKLELQKLFSGNTDISSLSTVKTDSKVHLKYRPTSSSKITRPSTNEQQYMHLSADDLNGLDN